MEEKNFFSSNFTQFVIKLCSIIILNYSSLAPKLFCPSLIIGFAESLSSFQSRNFYHYSIHFIRRNQSLQTIFGIICLWDTYWSFKISHSLNTFQIVSVSNNTPNSRIKQPNSYTSNQLVDLLFWSPLLLVFMAFSDFFFLFSHQPFSEIHEI